HSGFHTSCVHLRPRCDWSDRCRSRYRVLSILSRQRPSRLSSPDGCAAIPREPTKSLPAAFHSVPALRVPVDRLRSTDRHRGRDRRGPSNKGMRHMATIGTFVSTGNGFNGSIKTLNLNVKAKLVRIENPSDKGPHFRIFSGNVELGAAWQKVSAEGRDYLSV